MYSTILETYTYTAVSICFFVVFSQVFAKTNEKELKVQYLQYCLTEAILYDRDVLR
jgi:hypothetical protein